MKTHHIIRLILILGLMGLFSISSVGQMVRKKKPSVTQTVKKKNPPVSQTAKKRNSSVIQAAKKKNSSFSVGVKGGMSFTSISYVELGSISETMSSNTGFSAGIAFKIKLPVRAIILQPEILYITKGAKFSGDVNLDVEIGYVEVPLNIQYALDLILFKPFIEFAPYIGYAVYNSWETESSLQDVTWDQINRLDYGLGLGAGINIWKVQVKAKYSWSLAKLTNIEPQTGILYSDLDLFVEQINKAKHRGLEVSLAFFF